MFNIGEKDKEYVILTGLLILSVFLLCICWGYRDAPELFSGGDELYEYLITIILGYIVSYIFYYINIYLPKIKAIKSSCCLIGDCMAYVAYNMIMISDVLNKDNSELFVRLLNQRGIMRKYHKGYDFSNDLNEFQLEAKQFNKQLRNLMYEHIRSSMPSLEHVFERNIHNILSWSAFECTPFIYFQNRDTLIQSYNFQLNHVNRYEGWQIKLTKNRMQLKLDKLLENTDLDWRNEYAIIYGNI